MHIFENKLFLAMAVQHKQHVDAVGCHAFFRGLISMFVFGIVKILNGCIQDHRGCIAPTPPPPAMCLMTTFSPYGVTVLLNV